MTEDEVLAAVRERWGLPGARVEPLGGGMNSSTWTVAVVAPCGREARWVAKLVRPHQRDAFVRGLRAAALVDAAGTPAGAPRATVDGADHVDLHEGPLALLRWVDGTPLDEDDVETPALMGATLGAAHGALRGVDDGSAETFPPWLDLSGDHLDVEPWVRPAVSGALAEHRALTGDGGPRLQVGLLHADPAPDAFLRSATGGPCGLIDWSGAEHGPLLYDVASAVMYVGGLERGTALVEAYAAVTGEDAASLLPQVEVLLALRQAVQADYFARRLAVGDLTGIDGPEGNLEGLHHARDFFDARA